MKLEMGLCFETSTRPAAGVAAAISTCESVDRWLPNIEQVVAFQEDNLAAPQPEEWTDTLYDNGTKVFAYTAQITVLGSEFGPKEAGQAHAYRCVALPSS
ncbi:MAG TPA: hypothetical protein VJL81_02670 [Solirubrobacterales bacterium]|nr:hypothetical protein [Solirubrobacterales bacterium]